MKRDETVSLPSCLRSAIQYKVALRHDLLAMFKELGVPQVFLTWTVNLRSTAFRANFPSAEEAMNDVGLFAIVFHKEWERVWSYIHKEWAKKVVGGVRSFAWVLEYQERGAPHVHIVLWTGKTLEELINQNNRGGNETVITCARHHRDPEVQRLVARLQMHEHTKDYCVRESRQGGERCRFDFPRQLSAETKIENGRVVYQRDAGDEMVNAYNPDLLRMFESNMDIQFNIGDQALLYLAKYISKPSEVRTGNVGGKERGDVFFAFFFFGTRSEPLINFFFVLSACASLSLFRD